MVAPSGSLFQCLTTLSVKKFCLIFNVNLPCHNLRLFPLSSQLHHNYFLGSCRVNKVSPEHPFLQKIIGILLAGSPTSFAEGSLCLKVEKIKFHLSYSEEKKITIVSKTRATSSAFLIKKIQLMSGH